MESKASGKYFLEWGFQSSRDFRIYGFFSGIYGYEQESSEFMTMVFSGLGGALGGHLLDLLWKKFSANSSEKESHSKH